ncbi:MAG: pyridoxamine 5'-phosphate oxidase family protein [Bacteroidota bacterium]
MGKIYDHIPANLQKWIPQQKLFFVASAPLSGDGLINLSPKGLDSFRILDEHTVAYLDLTGSGVETIAHVQENQRLTMMFCAFEGAPNIVRLYGKAEVHQKGTEGYAALSHHFPEYVNARSIIVNRLSKVTTACGYAVPYMDYRGDRDVLDKWAEKKGPAGIDAYQKEKNTSSLDGMTGLKF